MDPMKTVAVNVIKCAIHHFVRNNLDAIFLVSNAPARSAFNRVERRMVPLSKELSGIILPHDEFGSHLDSSGKTIDIDLEIKNFDKAGNILAEIWSNILFDTHPVVAEYISPLNGKLNEKDIISKDDHWIAQHVRSIQYLLQIVKCNDNNCCSPMRSNLSNILPNRFVQAPMPILQTSAGIKI